MSTYIHKYRGSPAANVIKFSSKTRAEIKMESETAQEKPCAVCFIGPSKEKVYSKQREGRSAKKIFM